MADRPTAEVRHPEKAHDILVMLAGEREMVPTSIKGFSSQEGKSVESRVKGLVRSARAKGRLPPEPKESPPRVRVADKWQVLAILRECAGEQRDDDSLEEIQPGVRARAEFLVWHAAAGGTAPQSDASKRAKARGQR